MSTPLLALVVLAAALACPAHILWQMRRGRKAACCVPAVPDDLGELRARQQALGEELARRGEAEAARPSSHRVGAKPG